MSIFYLRQLVEFYAQDEIVHIQTELCSSRVCSVYSVSLGLPSVQICSSFQFTSFVLLQLEIMVLICAFKVSCSLFVYSGSLWMLFSHCLLVG